jgi:hypothetical protein
MRRAHKLSGGLTYLRAEVTRLETKSFTRQEVQAEAIPRSNLG